MTTLYNQIKHNIKKTTLPKINETITLKISPTILHEYKILILTQYNYDIPIDENYYNFHKIMKSRYSKKIISPLHENMYLMNWIEENI